MDIILSKNNINIRLTDERWAHIVEEHNELAGFRYDILDAVANPEKIIAGNRGELFALREITKGKYLVVVYRELTDDGFIITAFLTRRLNTFNKRQQLWPLN